MNVADDHCQGRLCIAKPVASDRSEKRCSTNEKFIRMGFAVQSRRILGLEYYLLRSSLKISLKILSTKITIKNIAENTTKNIAEITAENIVENTIC